MNTYPVCALIPPLGQATSTWANFPSASSVPAGTVRIASDYNYTEWVSDGTYWKPRGGRQRIYNTIISFSTTGSTAEVAAWTPTIPAGMLFPGCRISGELTCRKTGVAGTIAPRMRYNGAGGNMLSGNLTLAAGTLGYAWGFSVPTGSVTAGTITLLQVVPQSIVVTGSTTVAATTATHTMANAVTLNVTVQLGSAADTALVDYGYIEICG